MNDSNSSNFKCIINFTDLSNVSSSSWFKSHVIYSSAASVILEHQLKSKQRRRGKFSAISSTPSSVTLLHPESDSTVRFGKECTETNTNYPK